MKKTLKFIVAIFCLYSLIICFLYPLEVRSTIYDICELWLMKVLLSLVPFYFLSNILVNYPIFSKLLYKPLDKILHFECERSCSLLLLSTITGNPTSSLLVINSVKNNEITENEGNRLLKCTVMSTPLFMITMLGNIGLIIYITQIIVSFIFYYRKKVSKTYRKQSINNNNIFEILDNTPSVMLKILSSMVFMGLINICLIKLFHFFNVDNMYPVRYFLDLFELTTGLDNIIKYNINLDIIYLLSTFLLSFGGFSIIIQILFEIKKTSLSKTSSIISRILHGIISCVIMLVILKFFV